MEPFHHSLRTQARVLEPLTPNHSPHGSVNSSSSSRTPLHTLTLHEYRKQQNSPASHATPSGKTLRRKAAAPALHKVERAASASSSRPLHVAQSAYQLTSYQALPPSPPHLSAQHHSERPFRSQSAEPYSQGGIVSSESTLNIGGKIGKFKAIKRLPKPPGGTHFRHPQPLANVTPPHQQPSPLRTTSLAPVDHSTATDSQPTLSTLSLSRFPQPPPFGPPLSPPDAEHHLRLNTGSFATAAPATPPATPAVIHYRGTSFDLVNPHESLWYHDIVTPPREVGSTDYLPLHSSDDFSTSPEMARKRPVYGDFASAYNSIACRNDTTADFSTSPALAAHTPGSSPYSSSFHSPESNLHGSQLATRQPATEAGFSIKRLTQTLTHHLSRTPKTEQLYEEELQDLSAYSKTGPQSRKVRPEGGARPTFGGEYPRSLHLTYSKDGTNLATSSMSGEASPTIPAACQTPPLRKNQESQWPLDRAMDIMNGSISSGKEHSSPYASHIKTTPLASMVPDEPSTPVGRGAGAHSLTSESNLASRPYYDEIASLYPPSSVYTVDGVARSHCSPSVSSKRQSVPFGCSIFDPNVLASEYQSDLYAYDNSQPIRQRVSQPLGEKLLPSAAQKQGIDQTDTISKLIDNYKRVESTTGPGPALDQQANWNCALPVVSSSSYGELPSRTRAAAHEDTSDADADVFRLDMPPHLKSTSGSDAKTTEPVGLNGRPRGISMAREPPSMQAPLPPPFEYDEMVLPAQHHDQSDVFSGDSSYGDTRQLLQLSHPTHGTEPSSPYSQLEIPKSPATPQAALDLAGQIFDSAANERKDGAIPAMWARRTSGNLLRRANINGSASAHLGEDSIRDTNDGSDSMAFVAGNQEMTVDGEEYESSQEDWETIPDTDRHSRHPSIGESLADVSTDSDSSRDSLGYSTSTLRIHEDESLGPGPTDLQHQDPSPIRVPHSPFHSYPPEYMTRASTRPAPPPGPPRSPVPDPPVEASTVPGFVGLEWMNSNSRPSLSAQPAYDPIMGLSNKETEQLLIFGPNDEILYEDDNDHPHQNSKYGAHFAQGGLGRNSTFNKLTAIGPRGNPTGSPQHTGMKEVGSSEADNSSSGAALGSRSPTGFMHSGTRPHGINAYPPLRESTDRMVNVQPGYSGVASPMHAKFGAGSSTSSPEHGGFYISPGRRSSVTRVTPGASFPRQDPELEQSPSQVTLFPRPIPSPPRTMGRTYSRPAVPGQTRLREMLLAPDRESLTSTRRSYDDSAISRVIQSDGARPSTSHTNTPLRTQRREPSIPNIVSDRESPHLLCPEVALEPCVEAARNKLSWKLFAWCCMFPPILLLFHFYGDHIMVTASHNRFLYASARPKKAALIVGLVVCVGALGGVMIGFAIARSKGIF